MNSPRGITEILPNEKESSLEEFLPRNPEDTRPDLSAPYARTAQKARGKKLFCHVILAIFSENVKIISNSLRRRDPWRRKLPRRNPRKRRRSNLFLNVLFASPSPERGTGFFIFNPFVHSQR
jgi:hypothetical protein